MKKLLALLLVASCGGSTPAPTTSAASPAPAAAVEAPPAPSSPANEALAQAALAEQYDLGKRIYVEKKCATCHGEQGEGNPKNPPVIGAAAFPETATAMAKLRKGVSFKTAGDVLAFVKAKMPIKEPGTLTDDEAAAVTSWMLSESKVAISAKLEARSAATLPLR